MYQLPSKHHQFVKESIPSNNIYKAKRQKSSDKKNQQKEHPFKNKRINHHKFEHAKISNIIAIDAAAAAATDGFDETSKFIYSDELWVRVSSHIISLLSRCTFIHSCILSFIEILPFARWDILREAESQQEREGKRAKYMDRYKDKEQMKQWLTKLQSTRVLCVTGSIKIANFTENVYHLVVVAHMKSTHTHEHKHTRIPARIIKWANTMKQRCFYLCANRNKCTDEQNADIIQKSYDTKTCTLTDNGQQ